MLQRLVPVSANNFQLGVSPDPRARAAVRGRLLDNRNLWLMLAHDLKNPLTGISRVLEMATRTSYSSEPSVKTLLDDAKASCGLMLDMIDEVLDAYRSGARSPEVGSPVTIDPVFHQCVTALSALADKQRVTTQVSVAKTLPRLRIREGCLTRIVLNLLHNAIQSTPAGGRVLLSANVYGHASVMVSVSDQGNGIHHWLQRHTATRSSEPLGTGSLEGLGLFFCCAAVNEAGGRMWFESPLMGSNRGTKLYFTLPAEP